MLVKGAVGVVAAVFVGVIPKRWRLRLRDALVYGGALAALALMFVAPAKAGLMNISGRIFYEPKPGAAAGVIEPVSGVIVRVRGATTQQSKSTSADGSFILESVPSSSKELYFDWGGAEERKATIDTPTGGE